MSAGYEEFLARRAQLADSGGFEPTHVPDHLFDFQRVLLDFAVRHGRAALFADCGMGKTPTSLAWAQNVHEHTGKPILLLTPPAVGPQFAAEAEKFGYEAAVSRTGQVVAPITVTNYEQLHKFDAAQFAGTVCDESSILKSFDGTTKAAVTEFMRRQQYRLLATATAAPNDYTELGTSSEALGGLGYMDMLTRFFINKDRSVSSRGRSQFRMTNSPKEIGGAVQWRLKGHAEEPFWRWVASWARAIRRPSDYGFDDGAFVLPELVERVHAVEPRMLRDGEFFDLPAVGLREEREENRRTLNERCEAAAEVVERSGHDTSLIWCNLNDEGDLLQRLIPRSIQVKGSDSTEVKEKAVDWFAGRRCICNDRAFASKLAAWDGSPSTRRTAAASTRPTPTSELDALVSREMARRTASTCASTTKPSPRSSAGHLDSKLSTIAGGASDTPTIPNTVIESDSRQSAPQSSAASNFSAASTDSLPSNTTDSSPSKAAGARSAVSSLATVADSGLPLITATTRGRSADSYAPTATRDSASSVTTPADLTAPGCTCGHIDGRRRLISKASIFGWGLNFQHCAHIVYFPTHSYESMYQAIRRCWRFGQTRPVEVDFITTPGGRDVLANLQRKAGQADAMFSALVRHMNDALAVSPHTYDKTMEMPSWLSQTSA